MNTLPRLRKYLVAGLTLAVFAAVVVAIGGLGGDSQPGIHAQADEAKGDMSRVWPLYGGTAARNMVNTFEKNIPDEWDNKELNVKWVARLGSQSYGGPVIACGKVYVGTNNGAPRNPKIKGDKGIIYCFRESDGQFLWQAVHDKLPGGQVVDWPQIGICSAPVVEGNRLYYISNRCEVVCADTEGFLDGTNDGVQDEKYKEKTDADIIWRLDMMKELDVFPHNLAACSALIAGDLVFVVTANGVDDGHINIPSPKAPSFIAVEKKTGKVAWQSSAPGDKIMHGQWSNPTYAVVNGAPQIIFPGGDGWLYAYDPATGKPIWKFDANPKDAKYVLGGRGTKSDFIATPVVHENKLYIGTGQDPEHYEGVGHLWCIDLEKAGNLGPKAPDNDVSQVLATNPNVVPPPTKPNPNSAAVWHFGGPASKELAEKIGRDYAFGRTMSSCAVHDGLVYAAELAGYLHCLDARTGEEYWVHDVKAAVWGSPYWVDGKVYLGTEDGDCWVYTHGKEKKEPKRIEMDRAIKSTPVAVNGVLYVMTETHLYAIAKK